MTRSKTGRIRLCHKVVNSIVLLEWNCVIVDKHSDGVVCDEKDSSNLNQEHFWHRRCCKCSLHRVKHDDFLWLKLSMFAVVVCRTESGPEALCMGHKSKPSPGTPIFGPKAINIVYLREC